VEAFGDYHQEISQDSPFRRKPTHESRLCHYQRRDRRL